MITVKLHQLLSMVLYFERTTYTFYQNSQIFKLGSKLETYFLHFHPRIPAKND